MKKAFKRTVSMVLVFMTVFSSFAILPSEFFQSTVAKAAEIFSSETGATETYSTDDFTYTLTDEYSKVQILSYIGDSTEVIIPDRIDGKKVTSIASSAFANNTSITKVTISDEVLTIGLSAFASCIALTSVVMGDGLETIGSNAFYNCGALVDVDFGNSVKTIGDYAFKMCKSIKTLNFPDSLETIGNYAFTPYYNNSNSTNYGSSITDIHFGTGIKTIGYGAFYNCDNITAVEIGESLTSIGNNAFFDCDAIKSVSISGTNATIANDVFNSCNGIESIVIGNGVTKIENNAFRSCTNANTITLSDSVKTLGNYSFADCTALTKIVISNGVETIGDSAFQNCTSVKTIKIGSSCTSISSTAFLGTIALAGITVSSENTAYSSLNGALFNKDKTTLLLYPKAKPVVYTVPDTVTAIADNAFNNADGLSEIVISDNVKTIGASAFYDCSNLTAVTMGKSVESIGNNAFYNCELLVDIDFGKSLKTIGNNAFKLCKSITALNFPDTLETIGVYAFTLYNNNTSNGYNSSIKEINFGSGIQKIGAGAFYNCDNITSVTLGKNLTNIGSNAFYDCDGITSVVISGSNATVEYNAFYSCERIENLVIGNGVATIGNYAFFGCYAITEIAIPDSVTSVGENAFNKCTSLKNISLGSGCTSISTTAFLNTTALESIVVSKNNTAYSSYEGALLNKEQTSIILYPKARQGAYTIPDTVTSVSDNAFNNCDGLTEITIGKGIKTIGTNAFFGCDALTKATIGDGVTTIGTYAFASCSALTNVVMGDSLETIGSNAFYNCGALVDVDFGNSVKTIGDYAFKMCKSIKTLNFPDSLETIGNYAFTPYYNNTNGNNIGSSITDIHFGTGIKTIGYGAFYNCDNITAVEIGESLTSLGNSTFYECAGIKSVSISGTNAIIGSNAFDSCNAIESLKIENGVQTINSYAFENCIKITEVTIPDSVKTLGTYVFSGCTSLKTVSIGSGCTNISSNAFQNTNALESVTVSADNTAYSSEDGILFNKDKTSIILYPRARQGAYTIPDTVTSISDHAFNNCDGLTEITIGNSVKTIGSNAFSGCDSLTKATIGDGVTTIGSSAFAGCSTLSSVTMGDSLLTIGENAFFNCGVLVDVDFGNSVKTIGNAAFKMCKSIKTLNFPDSLETIGNYAFTPYYNNINGNNVGSSITDIHFGTGLKTIGYGAFYNCDNITAVEIGESLTTIDSNAFFDCDGIKTVSISGTNAKISNSAFYNCDGIESIIIGNGVTTIDTSAFYNCVGVNSINISDSVTTIGNNAFYNCKSLAKLVLGKGLTSTGTNVVTGYSDLTVYCHENTYAHTFAKTLPNVTIEFVRDNFYITDLTLTQLSSNSATFTWNKPLGYDNVDHYIIYKDGEKYDETTNTSYSDTKLESGKQYCYAVSAVNTDELISEQKTIYITPACCTAKSIEMPDLNNHIGGLSSVKLTGIMNDSLSKSGATAKFLYSTDGKEWFEACNAEVKSDGVSYVGYWDIVDVVTGDYKLRFLFTDKDGGESFTDLDINVDRTHPAKVDQLTIIPKESTIELSWQISKEYDTKIYRIYRKADNEEEYDLISEIRDRDTLTYSDTKVESGVIYSYYIVGTDKFGQESLAYDVVSAGLIDDTKEPAFTKMTPASGSYIYGNYKFTVLATDNVGVAKTELYYTYKEDATDSDWELLYTYNGSSFSTNVDTTVMDSGIVYIKAVIYDAVGNFTVTGAYKYMCDNQGPEKVTDFTCVSTGGTIATLSWSDVSDDDIQCYVVEQKLSDGSYREVARSNSYLGANLTKLTPDTEYTYRVVGYDKHSNRGIPSDDLTIKTTVDTIAPVITTFSPAPGYYSKNIPLSLIATDDYQVKSLEIEASYDKKLWTSVTTLDANSLSATYRFDYNLDISKYTEGSLYIRAKVTDSYGNTTSDEKATCHEYIVDRTAPATPAGFKASSDENYVALSWNAVSADESFAYYRIYRSTKEDGDYTIIKNDLTSVNTYDTSVEYSATYYYKIKAVDKAGNESLFSTVISCKVKDDEEAPVIYDIHPANGNIISAKNCQITVSAADNAKLANLKLEYKTNSLFSTYTTLKEVTGNTKNNCTVSGYLPITELGNGTEVTVRATASDASGNVAVEKTATYTIDIEAPKLKSLSISKAEDTENKFTLSWNVEECSDLVCFYVYRQTSKNSSYVLYDTVIAERGKTSYTYTDDEFEAGCSSAKYKIEAYDAVANTSSLETETMNVSGNIEPIAMINCPSSVVKESEYLFDATDSYDDVLITNYCFDFGDGSKPVNNTDGKVIYSYSEEGTYTFKLTVTDNDGNVISKEKKITVTSRDLIGTVTVNVVDDNNNKLPNTPVYVNLGEESEQYAITDSNGNVTFELAVGTHTIASYKTDYLPVKQQVPVTGGESYVRLTLVNEPIVTGEFEIHRMTFDEIVAAGIDINAAENRNVVRIEVTLMYEKQPIKQSYYWNGTSICNPKPIYINTSGGSRKLTPYVIGGGSYTPPSGGVTIPPVENPTVVFIDVPVEMSFLKDFFSVSLHIVNHASSDFSLLDNSITLNVPDGLTVMKTDVSAPKANVYIEEIQGQTQETIKWILRGDQPGEYEISADYLGRLSYFNEPVTAKFVAEDTIEVLNASTLKVDIEASDTTFGGRVFYNIVVENTGKYEYNDFRWESPIETYYDEYIDANGNSYEMKEQRNVLAPGEKFVYHVFTQLKGGYNYLDSIIKDYGNSGAQVGVTLHEPEYFLDLFYEIFPEESGAFVYRVHDINGNPLDKAKIELNPDTILSMDPERDYALVEDRNIECNSIKVTCPGYYDYVDNDYNGPKWGKGETIVLHEDGVFAVDYVNLNNVNVLESNASFDIQQENADGSPKQIKFTSKIYGDVLSVDLVQNGKIITPVNRTNTPETFLYTNTYAVDKFTEGEKIYLSVTLDKTKHPEDPAPILLMIGVKKFVAPKMDPPTLEKIVFTVPTDVDFLGGYELSIDDFLLSGFSSVYNYSEREITYGINLDLTNVKNHNVKKFLEALEKDSAKLEKYDFKNEKPSKIDPKKSFKADLSGTITFKIDDDNKIHFKESTVELYIGGEISAEIPFQAGPVPLIVEVTFGGGFTGVVKMEYNSEKQKLDTYIDKVMVKVSLGVSLGIGCSLASAGAYADGSATLHVQIHGGFDFNQIDLEAKIGVYVKLLAFKKKFPIVNFRKEFYPAGKQVESTSAFKALIQGMYSTDDYELDNDLLRYNSIWNSPVSGTIGTQTLLENSYAGAKPQIVICGDDVVLVYLGVDKNSDVANAVSMYYSVFNKETGKWGIPAKFDDNNLTDSAYSLCVSDGKIHAVYAQSCNELSEESAIEDVAQSMELYTTTFDSNTKKFVTPVKLTDNNTLDTSPVLKSVKGVPTVVWLNNESNNVFLNDNTNSIYMSQFANGSWSTPKQIQSNLNTVQYIDVAQLSKNSCVVYSTDTDNDLSTTNDKTIWLYDCSTLTATELATETESPVVTAEIYDNPVVLWYNEGKLMQYDINGAQLTEVCEVSSGLSKGFELVSDSDGNYAIVYTENNTSICAMYLDTVTSKWSSPIVLVSGDENIENLEAEYINGKLTLMYDKTTTDYSGEMMELSSEFVTTVIDSYAKPEIISTFVDYDAITPSEEATLSVEVMNNGSTPTGDLEFNVYNYDGTLLGKHTTSNISLSSTESKTFDVPFTAPSDIINKDIIVTVNDATKQHLSSEYISLAVCDMYVDSYMVTKGDKKYIESVIKNYSYYASPATFEVFNRLTDEVYYSTNLSSIYNGSPRTVEIELDERYIDENNFISTRVISKSGDYYRGNDISMFEYLEYIPDATIATEPSEVVPGTSVVVVPTTVPTTTVVTVPNTTIVTEPKETTVPVTTKPVPTVPATTVPVTTKPVPTVPETTVPVTTKPVPTVPATTVPVTTKPVPTVPATTVPVTTKPVPTVPATTVPVTTVPVTTKPVPTVPPTTVPPTIPRENILIGDVNLDGRVSINDATLLQKYIVEFMGFNESQMLAGDCDFDRKVSVRDATLIQKYIVELKNCGYVGQYLVDAENATTAPVTTQPITTVPVTTKPVPTVPVTTKPVPTTIPVTTAPVTTVPVTTVPVTTVPVTTVPVTTQPVTVPDSNYTVTFTNAQNWGGIIYCYYWETGCQGPITWPGTAMRFVSGSTYTATVPKSADYLIFTNGSEQTVDIPFNGSQFSFYATADRDSGGKYYYATGIPTTTKTVTFTNSLKWGGTIYCYYWKSGNSGSVAWPGKAMNYSETNGYGETIYTADIPNDADCVIFTNGSNQTVDIYINNTSMKFYAKPEVDSSNHHYYGTW